MADIESGQLMALAWSLGWRIAAGIIIGYYVDQWLGSAPWLTLGLSITALVSGVRQMLTVLNAERESKPASDE